MQRFINLTDAEKNELFIRTASATNISPILLEKDFWVSWLLNHIFQMSIAKDLVFKGGTSLSKCFGLIKRFSEDIDITIDKAIFLICTH
jgi:predicted nucleotidyltransferase component of viral defense system